MKTEIEQNPPRSSVKKFTRDGDEYTAFYDPSGVLMRLLNENTHREIPAISQTFRRLADNNRGDKFRPVAHDEYIVVLAYNKAAGGYAGVRTWSPYSSKTEFDAWFKSIGHKDHEVVDEGVTEDRAIEICSQTRGRNYLRAALDEATDRRTGRVNPELARMRMMTVALAVGPRLLHNF